MHLYFVAALRRGDALADSYSARRPRRSSSFFRTPLLIAVYFWPLGQFSAQTLPIDPLPGQPKVAAVTLAPGKAVNPRRHKSVFEKVGLQPQQTVAVTLAYPPELAGRTVAIEPLDGGRVVTPIQSLIIGIDGTLAFQYQAGQSPGLYQVTVHYDTQLIALQFWVLDSAHLDNSPPLLTAP